jgi:multidrug efflux pump subunit AcrB
MVRLPRNERESEYYLEEMILRTPAGGEIPLTEAVTLERGRADTSIERRSGRRIVTVSADVRPRSQAGQIMEALNSEVLPELLQRYPELSYGYEGRQADRRESMQALLKGLGIALIIIFAMLAIPLNSYIQPLVIMVAIPFGVVGAVVGHLIMGYSLSVISLFGIVALAGVVVNDSLVLIDFANRRRRKGVAANEAVREAAIQRFRPILLTTLTTTLGLLPMALGIPSYSLVWGTMASTFVTGLATATFLTLFIVPVAWDLLTEAKEKRQAGRSPAVSPAPTERPGDRKRPGSLQHSEERAD